MLLCFVFCCVCMICAPLITIALFAVGLSYKFILAFFIFYAIFFWSLALYFHPYGRGGEYIDRLVDKVLREKK